MKYRILVTVLVIAILACLAYVSISNETAEPSGAAPEAAQPQPATGKSSSLNF